MSDDRLFHKHGLTGSTKQHVFDALYQMQQGKCFICGISQEEIEARHQKRAERRRQYAEELPIEDPARPRLLAKYQNGLAPVHTKLHIDHCHWTGRIRGLLCDTCNNRLGFFERYAFREKPDYMSEYDFADACDIAGRWLEENREVVFQYMQQERWLPRKDILFHLQSRESTADLRVGIEERKDRDEYGNAD